MDLVEVRIAALRERAQQVERGGGLVVAAHHALRIRRAALGGEGDIVDVVAAIGGEGDAVDRLGVGRARLGELPGHAADLHDRQLRRIGQHDRHLEDDAERVADIVRVELGEALGTVAALEEERLARRDLGQLRLELACLAREDERRIAHQLALGAGERVGVGVGRELTGFVGAPAGRAPLGGHGHFLSQGRAFAPAGARKQ